MNTKSKVFELLEKNKGESLSGAAIAQMLGISRTGVWKAVSALREDGYDISSANKRGYALSENSNVITHTSIQPYLQDKSIVSKIHLFKSVGSTNKIAKEMAINGCLHGTIIIADGQTQGQGRYGRPFFSPQGDGLYMSFVLRPDILQFQNPALITASAAVAVCEAIEAVCGKSTTIKWVNDILLNGKKVCGILTEAMTDYESGNVQWIVLGIGINIRHESFPDDIKSFAGSIYGNGAVGAKRSQLAAEIINRCLHIKSWEDDESIYNEYKKRSAVLGLNVTVVRPDETYPAKALDINKEGCLVVKKANGKVVAVHSGEVSVKIISKQVISI